MKALRQLHLFLGCFFAPMILYFALSGVWQVFRFNDLPKRKSADVSQSTGAEKVKTDENDVLTLSSRIRGVLHELSKPHKSSTAPGSDPRSEHSRGFDWIAAVMGFGLATTTVLGIVLALRFSRKPSWVMGVLLSGILIPVILLYWVTF